MSARAKPLVSAVKASEVKGLEALRDLIAKELADGATCATCGGSISSPTAALAKQLRDTLAAIEARPPEKGSVTDDLRAKRARRQARVSDGAGSGVDERSGSARTRS